MRVSLDSPVGAGRAVSLKKDHRFSGWFWDHEISFCRRHIEQDRRRQIDSYLRDEQLGNRGSVVSPEAEQPVAVTS